MATAVAPGAEAGTASKAAEVTNAVSKTEEAASVAQKAGTVARETASAVESAGTATEEGAGTAARVAEAAPKLEPMPEVNPTASPGTEAAAAAKGSPAPQSPEITGGDLTGKTRTQIRELADEKGLQPTGDKAHPDYPRKWEDPATGEERVRLDRGHTDPKTGKPYDNPNAAKDHVHGYTPDGKKIKVNGDPHIPTTGE